MTTSENKKDSENGKVVGSNDGPSDRPTSNEVRTNDTVPVVENAVLSFDFRGRPSDETKRLNGSDTKKTLAFTGATGTTHEVCLNAIADVVGSRSKSLNVATSCGGKEVTNLNTVSVLATCIVTEDRGPDKNRT